MSALSQKARDLLVVQVTLDILPKTCPVTARALSSLKRPLVEEVEDAATVSVDLGALAKSEIATDCEGVVSFALPHP